MITIFKSAIKDRKLLLIIYCLSAVLLLWMYIALFPQFSSVKTDFIDNMPQGFLKAFNFDPNSFITIQGFLATEQFSLVWPMLMITLTLGYAGFAISSEIEKGTVEFLLSKPISRIKLFFSRYLAGLLMLVIFTMLSVLVAIPLCRAYNINLGNSHFYTMTWLCLMFGLAIYGLAFMFSAIFSEKGKVFFATSAILIAMYVINIVASIRDSLSNLKYLTFFYYYSPPKALVYNQIDHWAYIVFLGIFIVSTIVGLIVFLRRDITV